MCEKKSCSIKPQNTAVPQINYVHRGKEKKEGRSQERKKDKKIRDI